MKWDKAQLIAEIEMKDDDAPFSHRSTTEDYSDDATIPEVNPNQTAGAMEDLGRVISGMDGLVGVVEGIDDVSFHF